MDPTRPVPDLCVPAGLIADRARASMLIALDASGVLSGTELARSAGVSAATASEHLHKLVDGGLVLTEHRSRLRLYRLSGPNVARALQALGALGHPDAHSRAAIQRSRHVLDAPDRLARSCYDHLAGRLGVDLLDQLVRARYLSTRDGVDYQVRIPGRKFLDEFGVDLRQPSTHRRPYGRGCLDRTERRTHLGGLVGARLAARFTALNWIERIPGSRAVRITPAGRRGLRSTFGVKA
jgi:DNA-binding transcriptional ArsR family regulator